jgi:hypothetical protein
LLAAHPERAIPLTLCARDAWLEGRRGLAIDGRPLRPPRECPRE